MALTCSGDPGGGPADVGGETSFIRFSPPSQSQALRRTAPLFLEQGSRLLLFHLDCRSSETAPLRSQPKSVGSWFFPVFRRSAQGVQIPKGVPLSYRRVASWPVVVHLRCICFQKSLKLPEHESLTGPMIPYTILTRQSCLVELCQNNEHRANGTSQTKRE